MAWRCEAHLVFVRFTRVWTDPDLRRSRRRNYEPRKLFILDMNFCARFIVAKLEVREKCVRFLGSFSV